MKTKDAQEHQFEEIKLQNKQKSNYLTGMNGTAMHIIDERHFDEILENTCATQYF